MKPHDKLVLIGGSAGSIDVLLRTLPALHTAINLTIVIVLHRKAGVEQTLVELLSSKTRLHVKEAEEKEKILPNTIYLAPPDYHLLFEKDHTSSLDYSEKLNYSRPSIDVSFESAAYVFGPSLVCIFLSGASADGAEGLKTVRQSGGVTIIQDPSTA